MARNVLGSELQCCCNDPVTGFFRNGKCDTNGQDTGMHTVCVEMTQEFLQFAKDQGNDLITPSPDHDFPGLKPGDRWCVCVGTVVDAIENQKPPRIVLNATHASVLEFVTKDTLMSMAIDA
ncbi:MAG: DUF2237 domain-containing protein [Lentisphaerae bacterium]|nr:DUF2237 domain-containing protein [Lentisphaerota bacterium]